MANFVLAQFHRRLLIHQIPLSLLFSNWKIGCHFWIKHSIWTWVPIYSHFWRKWSPWCTTPELSSSNREMRAIGRRVKRPLTRPQLNVRGVDADSLLFRPLAGPKPTLRHSKNSHCVEIVMKLTNKSEREKWTNPAIHQRAVPASTLRCQSKETMKDPRSVVTGSWRSIDQICQIPKKKSVAAVEGQRSSHSHLDGSVPGAAGQSTIVRVPPQRKHSALWDESKTMILSIDSFIYRVIEAH